MTSNILRIFGVLVLVCLIYLAINIGNKASQPEMKAARAFMTAFLNRDRTSVEKLLDSSVSSVSYAGDRITGIDFQAQNIFPGAFSKAAAVQYSYLDIKNRWIPRDATAKVTPDNTKATVTLEMNIDNKPAPGGNIYLRQDDGQWKVFYIEQAPQQDAKP